MFNHYVKTRVTFIVGPARPRPGKVRSRPGPARPAACKTITYQPGPGPGLQVSGPHPAARPAKYHRSLRRPAHGLRAGPGRPGPRTEARPVQDPTIGLYPRLLQ